jgi:signal transduction histidine kinase
MTEEDDGLLEFVAEGEAVETRNDRNAKAWRILVVDDDSDILTVTRTVLEGTVYLGRRVELLFALSAEAARTILETDGDIAVVLLDVVMETDDAGLQLVRAIRDQPHLAATRIILRTGQPGYAPERDIIQRYDINDYRLKSELTAQSLFSSVIAALRSHQEISARIEAEQAVILTAQAKSRFLATVTHELRTPLNGIIGFSEIIARQSLGPIGVPRYGEYIETIHRSALRLDAVISDILEMSRIESGSYVLQEQPVAIQDVVRQSLSAIQSHADAAGILLDYEPNPDLPPVLLDDQAMKLVLVNLLSNAIKFSARGSTVRLRERMEPGGALALIVSDRGIGMPAHKLHQLFNPFAQLDQGTDRHYDGTGLGLAIVKGLVDLHAGSVAVVSREKVGTRVTIRLPASRVEMG